MLRLLFMPWYRRNSNAITSTIEIKVNGYTAPYYRYDGTLKAVIGGTGLKFYKIVIYPTYTQFNYKYNDNKWSTYQIYDTYKVFKEFYTDEEIDTTYFTPLGETILNGTYNMKKNDLSNVVFWLDERSKIKQNNVYTSFFGLICYNNIIKIAKRYQGTSYKGYSQITSYLNVPIYLTADYRYKDSGSSPFGSGSVDAQETILYDGEKWVNNYDGIFYFNNVSVPNYVAQWFNENSYLPNNSITIKYKNNTLASLSDLYEIKSALLTTSTNKAYLTITDLFNTSSTIEFPFEEKEGLQFQGLSLDGKTVSIPPNTENPIEISLVGNVKLYEVWQTYRPPTTTFDINLYKNSAEPNKVDKTSELSTVGTISGVLRQECSLVNPEIIIQYDKPPDFNYCYIANFGRYYYVENIVSMRQNLWRVRLRCDVLMTYKTQILNLTARIARQQYIYSYRQIDSEIPFTNDPEITVEDIPNSLNLGTPGDDNILLTVVTDGT